MMPGQREMKAFSAWPGVKGEWKPVYGHFPKDGVSVSWYDFECDSTLDWSSRVEPESLEICLNFDGCGTVSGQDSRTEVINPQTIHQYSGQSNSVRVDRHAAQRHRFMTVVMSSTWLSRATHGQEEELNPGARAFLSGGSGSGSNRSQFLSAPVKRLAEEMLKPPLAGPSLRLWFPARIQELVAHTLTGPPEELFCQRHNRVIRERVEHVKKILAQDLEYPPSLAELGRKVGCSPSHLSRQFSEQVGTTISRYLRTLRLERAAELLRSGDHNVTEAAMIVGYSSLSHFSKAFADMFGECPCAFSLARRK